MGRIVRSCIVTSCLSVPCMNTLACLLTCGEGTLFPKFRSEALHLLASHCMNGGLV